MTWKVRADVKVNDVPVNNQRERFKSPGILGFDFSKKPITAPDGKSKRINLLELLIHLFPGDWKELLRELNDRIRKWNDLKENSARKGKRVKGIREISENEFWKWWGIVVAARIHGKKGDLWEKVDGEGYGASRVDLSPFMTHGRFQEIRSWIPML